MSNNNIRGGGGKTVTNGYRVDSFTQQVAEVQQKQRLVSAKMVMCPDWSRDRVRRGETEAFRGADMRSRSCRSTKLYLIDYYLIIS